MKEKRLFITAEEAIGLLPKGKTVHTFRNPSGMLIGADLSKSEVIKTINNASKKELEIGGDTCKGLGHALIVSTDGLLFIEADKDKVILLEKKYGHEQN